MIRVYELCVLILIDQDAIKQDEGYFNTSTARPMPWKWSNNGDSWKVAKLHNGIIHVLGQMERDGISFFLHCKQFKTHGSFIHSILLLVFSKCCWVVCVTNAFDCPASTPGSFTLLHSPVYASCVRNLWHKRQWWEQTNQCTWKNRAPPH